METLTERERKVLEMIMNSYIVSAEPVGSRTLSKLMSNKWSSATIRNVMADLEEQGFLYKPHVVAGRIPTGKAFRYYVNSLLVPRQPGKRELLALEGLITHRYSHVEEIMGDASRILASLCRYTGIVVEPKMDFMSFKEVEFVKLSKLTILVVFVNSSGMVHKRLVNTEEELPQELLTGMKSYLNERCEGLPFYSLRRKIFEDMTRDRDDFRSLMSKVMDVLEAIMHNEEEREVYIEGTSKIIGVPELSDINRLRELFQAFEKKEKLLKLLDKSMEQGGINVIIGAENEVKGMRDMSIITSTYGIAENNYGILGVIGPLRMDYSRIIPIVNYTAQAVTDLLRMM
ncbi:MAG: Heat-inducible transcription repressor HrcA [Syntrophorhabdaceae bacterium PtaU1.Bin034]|jgi:heat-inducible transcriptional repressor|nr:MAG: Heat-inducible transcription repressor HrcA [Syntrophorhabdaceae bacterium PtaU1.Bin034]